MKPKKINVRIEDVLQELKEVFEREDVSMCTHLSHILSEYKEISDVTDKEFLFLIQKYKCMLELDENIEGRIIDETWDYTATDDAWGIDDEEF